MSERTDQFLASFAARARERHVVQETSVPCPSCPDGKYAIEEPGSETSRWARCQACGEYYYRVGHVACAGNRMPEKTETLNHLLGDKTLLPDVKEYIAETRQVLGGDWI